MYDTFNLFAPEIRRGPSTTKSKQQPRLVPSAYFNENDKHDQKLLANLEWKLDDKVQRLITYKKDKKLSRDRAYLLDTVDDGDGGGIEFRYDHAQRELKSPKKE